MMGVGIQHRETVPRIGFEGGKLVLSPANSPVMRLEHCAVGMGLESCHGRPQLGWISAMHQRVLVDFLHGKVEHLQVQRPVDIGKPCLLQRRRNGRFTGGMLPANGLLVVIPPARFAAGFPSGAGRDQAVPLVVDSERIPGLGKLLGFDAAGLAGLHHQAWTRHQLQLCEQDCILSPQLRRDPYCVAQ